MKIKYLFDVVFFCEVVEVGEKCVEHFDDR